MVVVAVEVAVVVVVVAATAAGRVAGLRKVHSGVLGVATEKLQQNESR